MPRESLVEAAFDIAPLINCGSFQRYGETGWLNSPPVVTVYGPCFTRAKCRDLVVDAHVVVSLYQSTAFEMIYELHPSTDTNYREPVF